MCSYGYIWILPGLQDVFFFCKTVKTITTPSHYVLWREFTYSLQLNYWNYFLNYQGSSNLNPKSINASTEGRVNENIQNTSSVTPARYRRARGRVFLYVKWAFFEYGEYVLIQNSVQERQYKYNVICRCVLEQLFHRKRQRILYIPSVCL